MLKIKRLLFGALITASVLSLMSCGEKKEPAPVVPPITEIPDITLPDEPSTPEDTPTEPSNPSVDPVVPTKPVEPSNPTEPTEPVEPSTPTEPTTPEVEVDPTDVVLPSVDMTNAVLAGSNGITSDAFYLFETKTLADFNYVPSSAEASWSSNEDGSKTYSYASSSGNLNFAFVNQSLETNKIYSSDGKYYLEVSNVYDNFASTKAKTNSTIATVAYKEENGIYSGEFSLVIELAVRLTRKNNFLPNNAVSTGASLVITYKGSFTDKTINYSYTFNLKDNQTSTNDVKTTLSQSKDATVVKDTPFITVVNDKTTFDLGIVSSSSMTWTTDTSTTTLNIQDTDAEFNDLEFGITFTQGSVAIVLDDKDVYGNGELKGLTQMTF